MNLGIKNKIALVTGSSRGIGKASAISLAKEDVNLIICGRDKQTLNQSVAEIKQINPKTVGIQCDVTNENNLDTLVKEITENIRFVFNSPIPPIYSTCPTLGPWLSGSVLGSCALKWS